MNSEFPNVQAGFKKAEEPEVKLSTAVGSSKKHGSSKKASTSVLLTMPKSLTTWIKKKKKPVENSERDGTTRSLDLPPEKSVCRSGNNS